MNPIQKYRTATYKPGLFAFCGFALVWITLLLFAGGFTTSIKAGMAFLDWPLSDGSINPAGWLTERDKMAEHSHRLLGAKIGLLSLVLWIWTWLREERKGVRLLARLLVLVVILQGVLGGARVRFDQLNLLTENNWLAQTFAVLHACGAQIVLLLLVTLTVTLSRRWIERRRGLGQPMPESIARLGWIAAAVIFCQILLGAIMRHANAGLAIPRFPMAREGSLFPSDWDFGIGIHFAHRAGAVVVTLALVLFLGKIWGHANSKRALGAGAVAVAFLLGLQIYLGALTIWTGKNPHVATAHMLLGAFLLASTWGLALLAHRAPASAATAEAADSSTKSKTKSADETNQPVPRLSP